MTGKARRELLGLHDDECCDNLLVCSRLAIRRKAIQNALNSDITGMTLQSKKYPAGQNWR